MIVKAIRLRPKSNPFPLFAWVIMIFQGMAPWRKNSYSHFAIYYQYNTDGGLVIDSTGLKGISLTHEKLFFKKYKIISMYDLPSPSSITDFNHWVNDIIGRKYDFLQLLGIASKVLGFVSFNKFGSNYRRMICNEVILNYLERFTMIKLGDPDNYDLNMTWDAIISLK